MTIAATINIIARNADEKNLLNSANFAFSEVEFDAVNPGFREVVVPAAGTIDYVQFEGSLFSGRTRCILQNIGAVDVLITYIPTAEAMFSGHTITAQNLLLSAGADNKGDIAAINNLSEALAFKTATGSAAGRLAVWVGAE